MKLLGIALLAILIGAGISAKQESKPAFAKPGECVAQAASYDGPFYSEPNYETQKPKTFDWANIGNAWDSYMGNEVKVAVLDSGINYDHEDFLVDDETKVNINSKYYSWNTTSSSWEYYSPSANHSWSYLNDTLKHGTNVAATIAAALNGVGGMGIAPNVDLYVYKVTNSTNGYETGAIQNALYDCIQRGIDVINMSFQNYENDVSYNSSSQKGSAGASTAYNYYVNLAYNAGITLVGAAGNFDTDEPSYPGSCTNVINVGSFSSNNKNQKAGYSNYGTNIDLVAPGYVNAAGIDSDSYYNDTSGTSFSAPIVTAAIALYKQKYPTATPASIKTALLNSCDPIQDDSRHWAGAGALNIANFLGVSSTPLPDYVPLPQPTPTPTETEPEIVSIVNNVDPLVLTNGDTTTLQLTATFDDDSQAVLDNENDCLFESQDESICTVDDDGTVHTVGVGSTQIYIVAGNVGYYLDITVNPLVIPPTGITLNHNEKTLNAGESVQLTATISPNNCTETGLNWTSSDTSIATVSSSGLVEAKAKGTATITVRSTYDNTKYAACAITVEEEEWTVDSTAYKKTIFNTANDSGNYSSYENSWYNTTNGFRVDVENAHNNGTNWDYVKVGDKNDARTGTFTTHTAIDKVIREVKLTIDLITTANVTSIKLYMSSSSAFTNATEYSFTKASGVQTVTIAVPTANQYYKIEIVCTQGTSNGLVQLSLIEFYSATKGAAPEKVLDSIEATYNGGDLEVGSSFNKSDVTVMAKYTVPGTYGDTTLSNDDWTYTGFSSETAGDCEVTISYTEGGETKTDTIVITIVQSATPTPTPVDPTPDPDPDPNPSTAQHTNSSSDNVSNITIYQDTTTTSQKITAAFAKGSGSNAPKWFDNGSAIRAYGGNTLTITSSLANIKSISFVFDSGESSNAITASVGTYTNATKSWTHTSMVNTVTFTISGSSGHRRFQQISVTYYGADDFASDFKSNIICDNGEHAPSSSNWKSLRDNKFPILFGDDKKTLKNATANQSGTLVERMMARYDDVVSKYNATDYPNFIERSTSGGAKVFNTYFEKNTATIIILVTMVVSVTTIGVVVIRKRKENY